MRFWIPFWLMIAVWTALLLLVMVVMVVMAASVEWTYLVQLYENDSKVAREVYYAGPFPTLKDCKQAWVRLQRSDIPSPYTGRIVTECVLDSPALH